MPITDNASYVPTTNSFLAHWALVNAALGAAPPLVLKTALARAGLVTLRNELQDHFDEVQDKLNDVEIATGTLAAQKDVMLARLNEFSHVIEGYFGGTPLAGARPLAPGVGESEEKFVEPLRDMKSLWVKVNAQAAPPGLGLPLVLSGGLAQADFVVALGVLTGVYETVQTVEQNLKLARLHRDGKKDVIYEALKLYRLAVPVRVPGDQALLEALPDLTPKPGHTPKAVSASAVFVAPNQARVVYEASEDGDLVRYELRGNVGATFKSADAVVIATNLPGDAREFLTSFGLTQSGAKVALEVYVILNTGNEAGSASMVVMRP